jgi:hypothetical protein
MYAFVATNDSGWKRSGSFYLHDYASSGGLLYSPLAIAFRAARRIDSPTGRGLFDWLDAGAIAGRTFFFFNRLFLNSLHKPAAAQKYAM